jgi:hypothetical protein
LFLFSSARIFPLEGKDGLALLGQADAEKYILKIPAGKESCLSWDKVHVYGFGAAGCKITAVELTELA